MDSVNTETSYMTINRNSMTSNLNHSNNKIISLISEIENMYMKNLNSNNSVKIVNFQMIYSKCHEICHNRMSDVLYSKFMSLIEGIVTSYAVKLQAIQVNRLDNSSSDNFMNCLIENFLYFKSVSQTVSDSLLYLERIRQKLGISNVSLFQDCMENFFKATLLNSNKDILNKTLNLASKELFRIRNDKYQFTHQFEKIVEIFSDLKNLQFQMSNLDQIDDNLISLVPSTGFYRDNVYNQFLDILEKDTEKYFFKFLEENYHINENKESSSDEDEIVYLTFNLQNNKTNLNSCCKFIKDLSYVLDNEEKLFSTIQPIEKEKVLFILMDNLLIKNSEFLFNNGFSQAFKQFTLLNEGMFSDNHISSIYKFFFSFLDYPIAKNKFYQSFNEFLLNQLKSLENNFVKKNNFNKIEYFNFYQYIEEIYILKKKYLELLSTCMDSNTKVEQIIKSNFEKLVNKYDDFQENFVSLIHEEIKISIKNRSSKVQEFADKFLIIFKLINDKDMFELEYRKYLAKRLLRNSSMIKETEYEFYSIMRRESGSNFVKRIENMINDIFHSNDLNLEHRIKNCKKESQILTKSNLSTKNSSYMNSNKLLTSVKEKEIEFYVKILSLENWPIKEIFNPVQDPTHKNSSIFSDIESIQNKSINIPNILDKHIQEFTNFYYGKFKNRQLMWIHDLSWAEINAKFKNNNLNKNFSLIVSSTQMSILFLFNNKRSYYLPNLLTLLNIRENDKEKYNNLFTHLNPLLRVKLFSLQNDTLILNENFTNKEHRLILNNFKADKKDKSSKPEEKEISHFVLEDRKHHIDAAIMRILKHSEGKKTHYESLKSKVIEYVSNYFVPEVTTIKQRIDNLLDREFIARDMSDPNVFVYII
jgi:hypothetical protein